MSEKTSCLSKRKVRRKNQIFEYHVLSPKGYNKGDTRSIDKKPANPVGVLSRKTEISLKCDW